ncbi:MAG: hypothetical protein AAFQ82_19475, partial [Myxococcota bacterium]
LTLSGGFRFRSVDMNRDSAPELLSANLETLRVHRIPRVHVDAPPTRILAGTTFESPSAVLDRFGDPVTLPVLFRATVDPASTILRAGDLRTSFAGRLRVSGLASVPDEDDVAITRSWDVRGAFATSTRILDGRVEIRSPLDELTPGVTLSFPLLERVVGESPDFSTVRLFARRRSDWRRDVDGVTLPALANGATQFVLEEEWVEIPRDSDDDLSTGTGERFSVDTSSGTLEARVVRLGVFQGFVSAP